MEAAFSSISKLLAQVKPDEPPKNPDSGNPQTTFAELQNNPQVESGVWECTAGGWEIGSYPVDEIMMMLSGRLRVTDSNGTSHQLTKDDVFYLPKGWSGRWDVLEDMRKFYVILK